MLRNADVRKSRQHEAQREQKTNDSHSDTGMFKGLTEKNFRCYQWICRKEQCTEEKCRIVDNNLWEVQSKITWINVQPKTDNEYSFGQRLLKHFQGSLQHYGVWWRHKMLLFRNANCSWHSTASPQCSLLQVKNHFQELTDTLTHSMTQLEYVIKTVCKLMKLAAMTKKTNQTYQHTRKVKRKGTRDSGWHNIIEPYRKKQDLTSLFTMRIYQRLPRISNKWLKETFCGQWLTCYLSVKTPILNGWNSRYTEDTLPIE